MQEEARFKQSLFEYRQKLTLLHCVSKVTCVGPCAGCRYHGVGTEVRAGSCSVSVVGSQCWMGAPAPRLFTCPRGCPGPAVETAEQLL